MYHSKLPGVGRLLELHEEDRRPGDSQNYDEDDEDGVRHDGDGASPNSHKHFFPYMGSCASIWDNVRHHCHHYHHHHHIQKSKSINTEACLIAH